MSARTRVKICGLTSFDDAMRAVDLGADALGFVVWPGSPRAVSVEDAGRIARQLPAFVSRVGVFVNPSREELDHAIDEGSFDVVQLHGWAALERTSMPPSARDSNAPNVRARIVRATSLQTEAEVEDVVQWAGELTPIVDAHDPEKHGGTGRTADWTRAASLASRRKIILAGGLKAENVARAIAAVKPWSVDVSSGVESVPGRKDAEKLRAFFAAVKTTEEGSQ